MTLQSRIAANVAAVRARIEAAARAAARPAADIRLVAVSKTFGIDHVRAAVAAGLTDFGENRVQEALQKIAQSADLQIDWHLVGHLQSNKARKAAGAFGWIHSVDRLEVLEKLDTAAREQQARPSVLVQVDLASEPTKSGAPVSSLRTLVDVAGRSTAVRLAGLMVLPPFTSDPEGARPFFRRLRELRDEMVAAGFEAAKLRELSMGMSHDLEVAIQEGATIVRVGTAIFGPRTGSGR